MKASTAWEGEEEARCAGVGTLMRQGRRTRPSGTRTLVALQTRQSCTASGLAWSSALVRLACPLQSKATLLSCCCLALHRLEDALLHPVWVGTIAMRQLWSCRRGDGEGCCCAEEGPQGWSRACQVRPTIPAPNRQPKADICWKARAAQLLLQEGLTRFECSREELQRHALVIVPGRTVS